MKESGTRVSVQKIAGVLIILGVFVFLTIRGQEIPEWVQRLMVLGVGSLIVGAAGIVDLIKFFKSIRFTLEENEKKADKDLPK